MAPSDPLKVYREKRDFSRTPEPSGDTMPPRLDQPRFVIQKHDASRLHYDFRIEVGDVLKSWAVPKGPSTDPSDKRLAVATEDHPLAYIDFEGTIPEGEYGAGTMLVWDTGSYRNLPEQPVEHGLQAGKIELWLEGQKLRGGYALVRTGEENWLLIKEKDEQADPSRNPVKTEPNSVLSGRSLEQIAEDA